MLRVRTPKLLKLPVMAVEMIVGSAIVLAHLMIASRIDRPRALVLAGHTGSETPTEE